MLTGVTVRIRLLGLALLPLTMLVTVIAMAPANDSMPASRTFSTTG